MRLQVYLSRSRVCSRRKALDLVKDGKVSVNGKVICEPSFDVGEKDNIVFNKQRVLLKDYSYLVLNKPAGVVTTLSDRHAKRKVIDLLPKEYSHLYPVGRLDQDSEGLLIFTNDGDFAFKLMHPSFKVDKVYRVEVWGRPKPHDILQLERGVVIEGGRTAPANLSVVEKKKDSTILNITIHEGRKRQVRLMFAALGCKVILLKRIKYGPIELGNLGSGKFRLLSEEEVLRLSRAL